MDTERLNYAKIAPDLYRAMLGIERYVHSSKISDERSLLELVRVRASQINGCGWCIDMHTKDAIANGETSQRLFLISAWKESPQFTHREKLALEWCEALTNISLTDVSESLYQRALAEFTEPGIVALSAAVVAINSWNRLNIAFRAIPGTYQGDGHITRNYNTEGNSAERKD